MKVFGLVLGKDDVDRLLLTLVSISETLAEIMMSQVLVPLVFEFIIDLLLAVLHLRQPGLPCRENFPHFCLPRRTPDKNLFGGRVPSSVYGVS